MNIKLLPDPDLELDTRNPLVITVPDALSAAECAALIARIEREGPTPAPITTSRGFIHMPRLRNNTRVMFDDTQLADLVYQRVKARLPARLETKWEACGANERLRCYRYTPGQFFGPHFDGSFIRNEHERSLLTMMVYLNDCEAGGHTLFPDLEIDVKPRAGMALLFSHHLLHEGAEVTAGLKYAMRSDVMFRAHA